jgi:SAM-dependent methyltransferase
MKMGHNRVPRREIDRACNYGEGFESHLVEKHIVSFWRHRLSQYRMCVLEAIPSIQLSMDTKFMNRLHHWLCNSEGWRQSIQQQVPWVMADIPLGSHMLEIGPGPGLTTALLQTKVPRLTALEIDPGLAAKLRARLANSNVEVVLGDATSMPFPDTHFSASAAFTMLHHVPSQELQDRVLREAWRVLAPGGYFMGSDSLSSFTMRVLHWRDVLVAVDPDTFGRRLEAAGFEVLKIDRNANAFRFRARRPRSPHSHPLKSRDP